MSGVGGRGVGRAVDQQFVVEALAVGEAHRLADRDVVPRRRGVLPEADRVAVAHAPLDQVDCPLRSRSRH
jgi:hypothetical protein